MSNIGYGLRDAGYLFATRNSQLKNILRYFASYSNSMSTNSHIPLDFDQVYKSYFKILVAFANKYLHHIEDAEELVQTFFTDLYEKRDKLQIHKNLRSYLFQSVYHRCINHLNKKGMTDYEELNEITDTEYNIENTIEATEFEYQIFKLIFVSLGGSKNQNSAKNVLEDWGILQKTLLIEHRRPRRCL